MIGKNNKLLEKFEKELDENISYRKKELSTFKNIIDLSQDNEKEVLIRTGILLLYSHWEGFIKDSSSLYLKYIKQTSYSLKDLKICFIKNLFLPTKRKKDHFLVLLYKNAIGKIWEIKNLEEEIYTNNNLNYGVFQDNILKTIGFEVNLFKKEFKKNIMQLYGEEYLDNGIMLEGQKEIKKLSDKNIDNILKESIKILVAFRNNIGHGKIDFSLNGNQFEFIFNITREIIYTFKDIIILHFEKEKFLK